MFQSGDIQQRQCCLAMARQEDGPYLPSTAEEVAREAEVAKVWLPYEQPFVIAGERLQQGSRFAQPEGGLLVHLKERGYPLKFTRSKGLKVGRRYYFECRTAARSTANTDKSWR